MRALGDGLSWPLINVDIWSLRDFRCESQHMTDGGHWTGRNNRPLPPFVCQCSGFGPDVAEVRMNGIIYLIGLIVVIMAILSFLGLR